MSRDATRVARHTRDARLLAVTVCRVTRRGWEWLAGLFEGEGCLRKTRTNRWEMAINSIDFDVIAHVHDVSGVGTIQIIPARGSSKEQRRWYVTRRDDIAHVVRHLLPYLCERRAARAREFMAWYEQQPPVTGRWARSPVLC